MLNIKLVKIVALKLFIQCCLYWPNKMCVRKNLNFSLYEQGGAQLMSALKVDAAESHGYGWLSAVPFNFFSLNNRVRLKKELIGRMIRTQGCQSLLLSRKRYNQYGQMTSLSGHISPQNSLALFDFLVWWVYITCHVWISWCKANFERCD